jgi:1,4-alpha-glucan branching enzyme
MSTAKNPITNTSFANEISALERACFNDVFSFLGPHKNQDGSYSIRCYLPGATQVSVILASTKIACLQRPNSDLFIAIIAATDFFESYQLEIHYAQQKIISEDPYRFRSTLDEEAMYLFNEGNLQQAYRHFGAHVVEQQNTSGIRFAVWAPNAASVSVIGDFNLWNSSCHIMRKHPASGVWDIFIPLLVDNPCYKFSIVTSTGETLEKADPFASAMQLPPATASKVSHYQAKPADKRWLKHRQTINRIDMPISIYEVHAGSWRRVQEEDNRPLSYREMAAQLIPYILEMGFTHVQFMPLSEYPFEGSWGYQPVGLFSPSSRFGSAEDFAYLIQQLHAADIGVLLDWVPGHFPSDPHGLARFDGTHLFEHADQRIGFHPDWNTCIYNYGRNEVRSFLLSNANYWLDQFEIDGLRVDAVASMLYLDYSREEGQWLPNQYGGRENIDVISLLQTVNTRNYAAHPGILMIAEESTAWPGVTNFVDQGGLGFGFKWNMGWMNDSLSYMSQDPLYRSHHHDQLTFSMVYAYSENYILPISHDEVVHGKGSMINKMPGDHWQKFANLRAYYGFMWAHPGKKLLFMGCEFAQWQEWNHDVSLDWHLTQESHHQGVQRLVKDLNFIYRQEPALHQLDNHHEGFQWIDNGNAEQSVLSFMRYSNNRQQAILVVINMTPIMHQKFRLGVGQHGSYQQIINSDAINYGGSGKGRTSEVNSQLIPSHGLNQSVELEIAPLATMIYKWINSDE